MARNDLADALLYAYNIAKQPSYKIRINPYHPKNKPVYGTFTSRAHWFVEWLAQYLPFDPNTYFENVIVSHTWADPILIDDAAISYELLGSGQKSKNYTILCSEEQAIELRGEFKL